MPIESQWNIRVLTPEEQELTTRLSRELNISPLCGRMLVLRGIRTADEARAYIRPSLQQLHDPMLMRDMPEAVERLHRAIETGEKILVYGDYDVDGTTAVAMMYTFLGHLTQALDYYIPDRYTEGYGISFQGIDYAQQQGCSLVIALDCGIKAIDKVQYAHERGIDMIICDHHTPGDEIPAAVAVLNMKRKDCPYPYKDLSGCGVGYKLCAAYIAQHGLDYDTLLRPLLPMLAMSIASDIVSMTGENRILEHFGLLEMNTHPSVGIRAIAEVAGIGDRTITVTDLGFKFGPRINACGRLYSGREAVKLLITDDRDFARQQAEAVNSYNTERKDYDTQVTEEALTILHADPENESKHTTVVYSPNWHKGVVGIAASRLTEHYYRPTIVLTQGENGLISGSARSAGGFDIYTAIDSCRDLLTNFGGHAFAAGLSMVESNLRPFQQRFEAYVAAHIQPEQMHPTIQVEAEINLSEITGQMYNVMRCLEPFGPDNPRPVFVTRRLTNHHYTKRVGEMGKHLKLDVTDGTGSIEGIGFGLGEWALSLQQGAPVDICYTVEKNTFNGRTTLQMKAEEVRRSDE